MSYDADIIVIGAGPAGLSAAIRARWVKRSAAIPASVILLDPAGPGGIATMGRVNLTGPSFGFHGPDLFEHLLADMRQLEIPLLREAAVGLRPVGECWEVRTATHTLRSLAVVLATGLRCLSTEHQLKQAGLLRILSGSYGLAAQSFQVWSAAHQGHRLLLIGGLALAESADAFRRLDGGRNELEFLCEPRQQATAFRLEGQHVVITVTEEGHCREKVYHGVMLEYHSLLLTPPALSFLASDLRGAAGYSAVGPEGDPRAPGLFAAGDCTRPPSLCVKALAQGAEAGFNAYRYVFSRKFGHQPHLFAFYASPERPPFDVPELPAIDPHLHEPVGLTAHSRFLPDGSHATAVVPEALAELHEEMGEKIATVHRRDVTGDTAVHLSDAACPPAALTGRSARSQ